MTQVALHHLDYTGYGLALLLISVLCALYYIDLQTQVIHLKTSFKLFFYFLHVSIF